MTTYVKYELEDGGTLFVEAEEPEGSIVKVSQSDGNIIIEANTKFQEALSSAKTSTLALIAELRDLPVEEMEITFGLKSTGEAGFFAVGKLSLEANYQVTLKWTKPTS